MLNAVARETQSTRFPDLPAPMLEPSGLAWGMLNAPDGTRLRWAKLDRGDTHADCLLVGGFCEFIEKYFETIAALAQRGFCVWTFDWRGQGGSQRPAHDPHRPRARHLEADLSDLGAMCAFMGHKTRPRVLIGHSMGAAISLCALARHPNIFDAAVLCAPMVQVASGALPGFLARFIAESACALGFGAAYIPGAPLNDLSVEPTPENSPTSHDPVRCRVMFEWQRSHPQLRVDGITFDWYRGALRMARTCRSIPQLAMPTLIGVPGQDTFVDAQAIRTLIATQPHAELVDLPHARHELFHERDDIREAWFAAIDTFLARHVARP